MIALRINHCFPIEPTPQLTTPDSDSRRPPPSGKQPLISRRSVTAFISWGILNIGLPVLPGDAIRSICLSPAVWVARVTFSPPRTSGSGVKSSHPALTNPLTHSSQIIRIRSSPLYEMKILHLVIGGRARNFFAPPLPRHSNGLWR